MGGRGFQGQFLFLVTLIFFLAFIASSTVVHSAEEEPTKPKGFSCGALVRQKGTFSIRCEAEHQAGKLTVVMSGQADDDGRLFPVQIEILSPNSQFLNVKSSVANPSDSAITLEAKPAQDVQLKEYLNHIDMNFDGFDDIRMFDYHNNGTAGFGLCYRLFFFDNNSKSFKMLPDVASDGTHVGLSEIDCQNVKFYPSKKTVQVTELESSRLYHEFEYVWQGSRLATVFNSTCGVGFTFDGFDENTDEFLGSKEQKSMGCHATILNADGLITKTVHTKCQESIPCPLVSYRSDTIPPNIALQEYN